VTIPTQAEYETPPLPKEQTSAKKLAIQRVFWIALIAVGGSRLLVLDMFDSLIYRVPQGQELL